MSELNQNLNETVNTASQTETQTTTTTTKYNELKITFLGEKRIETEIIQASSSEYQLVNAPIVANSLVVTKNGTEYSKLKGNLNVDEEKGSFSYETVDFTGATATYTCKSQKVGLCAVLQVSGKNYIFDVGLDENYSYLKEFLNDDSNGITKIDGVVLTHFHKDHVGKVGNGGVPLGFLNLIEENSSLFAGCVFYLPHQSHINNAFDWDTYPDYYSVYQNIKDIVLGNANVYDGIAGASIISPCTEGESVSIDNNTLIKFYNVDLNYYNEYYDSILNCYDNPREDGRPSYNNFSMVIIVEHFGNKIAITGDIEYLATEKMAKVISDADVVQIEHHGLNHRSHINYLNNITAKIGIIPTCSYYQNNERLRPTANKIISNGGKVYYTGDCGNVTVVSNKYGMYVENDVLPMPIHTSMSYNLDYGSKILTEEDLNNLITPGVYCAGIAPIFNNLSNQPSEFDCGSKIIVENMNGNPKVLRQTVIKGNTKTPAIAYRNKNSDNIWSEWYYNYPSIYGKLTGGSYKISSNKEFEVFVRTEFTPTDSIEVAAGYYSNELYYSLKFLEDYGLMVENACVFGMSDYSYTIVNGEVLKRTNSQPDRVKFRLLKKAPITIGSGKLASLLIKGTLAEIPKEDN